MKKQVVLLLDAYGNVMKDGDVKPNPHYKTIQEYTDNGWFVTMVAGAGVASSSFSRGSFCLILEKNEQ